MRDRMLNEALRALTADAAYVLEDQLVAGKEIPFEVGEAGGATARAGAKMFTYRPLTAEFVAQHADQLRALPGFENAAQHLARTRGMSAYLRVRGEPLLDVGELTQGRLGALAFLAAVWADAEHFDQWEQRFERAYLELESVALAERFVTTVFVPVFGVRVECGAVSLGAGVELMPAEELDPACAERFSDSVIGADSYCAISADAPSDAPPPLAAVRQQARALLTALRMFKPGSVALGLSAQADVGGAWQQVALPFTGRAREAAWALLAGEEDELRQFIAAVRRVQRRTRVAWALNRFEMGLERTVPAEGLSDFLAALRALLESDDDSGKAALPARVAALCARDDERAHVRGVVESAFALERLAIDGHVGRADRKRLAKQPPLEVIAEAERCLRALLHDLVCGYLATDLKKLADEILLADGEPTGIETGAHEPVYLEPVPDPGAPPPPDPTATTEFDAVFDDTAEIKAIDLRDGERPAAEPPDNVWTLRPASELKPAPEVSAPEEQDFDEPADSTGQSETAHELAERLVERFDAELGRTMDADDDGPDEAAAHDDGVAEDVPPVGGVLPAAPAWDERPERIEPHSRAPQDDGVPGDFSFEFTRLDPANVGEPPAQPMAEPPGRERALPQPPAGEDFAVREFDPPAGPGPAAARIDDAVEGAVQRRDFDAIMDENFTPPPRDLTERPTTPLARDGHAHLFAIDGEEPTAQEDAAPVESLDEAAAPAASRRPAPADPQKTIEYDVLAHEPTAEENAQLAWSEQFLCDESADAKPRAAAPLTDEQRAPLAKLRLVPPEIFGTPEPAAAPPEESALAPAPPEETASAPADNADDADEHARNLRIGPATTEFRPLVEPDGDDPDDFAGAC